MVQMTDRSKLGEDKSDPESLRRLIALMHTARLGNVNVYVLTLGGVDKDFPQMLSNNTGGFAPGGANDYTVAIDGILRSNSSYYLIGYQATNPKPDRRFRRVEVKVNRPDVDVIARNGYFAESVTEPKPGEAGKPDAAAKTVRQALASLLPSGDLPMQVATAVLRQADGKGTATAAIILGIRQTLGTRAEPFTETVDVHVEAFTVDGDSRGSRKFTTRVAVKPGVGGPVGYEVLAAMNLQPGRYQLRLGARTASDGRVGSVFTDLVIPDFERAPVTLAAPLFSTVPSIPSAPRRTFETLLLADPTSLREFPRTMRVSASIQILLRRDLQSGGGTPRRLTASIVNERDEVVFTQEVDILRIATERQALVTLDLPVVRLTPGAYLLTFTVDTPAGLRRDVRFSVE
jgi:hypothetical protein